MSLLGVGAAPTAKERLLLEALPLRFRTASAADQAPRGGKMSLTLDCYPFLECMRDFTPR